LPPSRVTTAPLYGPPRPTARFFPANPCCGRADKTRRPTPISAFTADGIGRNNISPLLAGSWIVDVGSEFAGFSTALDGGLLWTAAGINTSSTLTSNGGVVLGALDLGAASGASQWQQFVEQFPGGSATGLADVPQLLWTGVAIQLPVTVAVPNGLQSLQFAPSESLPLAGLGSMSPTQLMWTQPAAATGLTTGPTLTNVAPPTPISGASIVGSSSSSNLPLAGAGSHS